MTGVDRVGALVRWPVLVGIVVGLLLWSWPLQAATPCDSATVIPDDQSHLRPDCEVLWAFYTGLDDPGVLDDLDNPHGWLPTTPFMEWQGLGFGARGLEGLVLPEAGLRGSITPELGRLTSLATIELDRNQLTGSIPSELGRVTDLIALVLFENQLTGSIPPELGLLPNLAALNLRDNQLVGSIPGELGQLDTINVLELSNNRLNGAIPQELGGSGSLTYMSLHTNRLTGRIPAELGQLSGLKILDLGGNQLEGTLPPELGKLTNLTYLSLHTNSITGPIPEELSNLTLLEILSLRVNQLTGQIPARLSQLSNLKHLDLSENQLEGTLPAELGNLVNLTYLSLHSNRLTGSIPAEWGNLVNLKTLSLQSNQLKGPVPPELAHLTSLGSSESNNGEPDDPEPEDIFAADPLRLIAHVDFYREYSLGTTEWKVWFCDLPLGDAPVDPEVVERRLNREVTPYFEWVSGDRYRPVFRVVGMAEGDTRSECSESVRKTDPEWPVLLVDDSAANDGYAGREMVVVGGGTVVTAPRFPKPRLSTVAHEIGHALGFPHSFGGKIRWSAQGDLSGVYEYDNPMDMMSGDLGLGLTTGTIAVNRYAAGWIEPDEVAVHQAGTTADYELRPPGAGGIQMLVLPTKRPGMFTALGARVAIGYDSSIPRQGVEVYRIDQQERACSYPWKGACWGTNRRTQPYPPTEAGAGYGDNLYGRGKARLVKHVHFVGDVFEIGVATTVEVVERVGNNYTVRVVDTSAPPPPPEPAEPSFAGRFSDDDGNVHEANIETMAELGITLGCNPPDNDRYCPATVVARAQMMAFLARALGEEGNPEITTSRFSDVPDSAWYLPYVERLADLGVVEPYEDGTFRPYEPLTRLDMAVFLARAFPAISEVADPVGVFVDVSADAEHAGAVEGILAAGVTRGCSTEPLSYCPDKAVPRDQMASFLARALKAKPTDTGETS